MPGIQTSFPANFDLSTLTSSTGLTLNGAIASGQQAGWSVSSAGDINADGIADLIIGAPTANSTGSSYVVFGQAGIASSGSLALSSLNGMNGFAIAGAISSSRTGYSVSSVGDINADGIVDLIIGAPYPASSTGACYVVFGQAGIGSSGSLALSSLNGSNGFVITGAISSSRTGYSVSSAGDINADGIVDLIIGAPLVNSNMGVSYVVFGKAGIGSSGSLALSSLNGVNGFVISTAISSSYMGYSVSSAGDINADGIADLIIGAPVVSSSTGASYVVFGQAGIGSSGSLVLSSLNGMNGFAISAAVSNSSTGYSVSSAGDINADGIADLIIGAPDANFQTGTSYVVFGKAGIGSSGSLALSSLNGMNGFAISAAISGSLMGRSVSSVSDINADGIDDLIIGAPLANSTTGASYVVFGQAGIGSSGSLVLSSLNGMNGFAISAAISGSYTGYSVSSAGDIDADGIADLIIGAPTANSNTGASYVVFGDIAAQLLVNRLTIAAGQTVILSTQNLNATDNGPVQFNMITVTHGQFALVSNTSQVITQFSQAQVGAGQVQFTHDGSGTAPSYLVQTPNTGIALTPAPQAANITFVYPQLLRNQLTLTNGETVVFSAAQLQASEPMFNNSALQFYTGIVQQGHFVSTFTNQTLTEFSQADVESGTVAFIHAGNKKAPGYWISVSDGIQITSPRAAAITFIGAPVIRQNSVVVAQSGTITLTPADLNITVTDGSAPGQVILQVTDLQDATITSNVTGIPIPVSHFTLAELQSSDIQLTQNGSPIAPSYTITATSDNSGLSSAPSPVNSHLYQNTIFAPKLLENNLFVTQGQSTLLTSQNLQATQDNGMALDDSAIFYVSNVANGRFTFKEQSDVTIPYFSKAQLQNNSVQFIQDGTHHYPAYSAAVAAFGLKSASMPAQIFFRTVNQPPTLVHSLVDQSVIAGQPFTYAIPPDTFTDPQGYTLTLSVSCFNSTQPLPDWLSFSEANHRFSGIPPLPEVDDIAVIARNSAGLTAKTDFVITVSPKPATSSSDTLEKAIISAAVTGSIGLLFLLLKVCLKRASNKKLLDALGEGSDQFDLNVVRPVAKEIARRVKITGFLSYTTNTEMAQFKGAVRTILTELSTRNVDVAIDKMDDIHRDSLINEIATQTQLRFTAKHSCCSVANCMSFFKPQATAEAIRQAAPDIADSVASATEERGSVKSISMQLIGKKQQRSEDLESSERGMTQRS